MQILREDLLRSNELSSPIIDPERRASMSPRVKIEYCTS